MSDETMNAQIENSDMAAMLEVFMAWSKAILENSDAVVNLITRSPEANAMYAQIRHAAIEVKYFDVQYSHLVLRFINLIRTLDITCNAMSEKFGEEFTSAVAPPPMQITFHAPNKDELH